MPHDKIEKWESRLETELHSIATVAGEFERDGRPGAVFEVSGNADHAGTYWVYGQDSRGSLRFVRKPEYPSQ